MIPVQTPPPPGGTAETSSAETADGVLAPNPTMLLIAGGVILLFLLVGLLVISGRKRLGSDPSVDSVAGFVRSWLGLGLVGGLLVLCVVSLGINDPTLRSTLFGGLIANVGAATAFYFASTGSDQARKDILAASLPAVLVPDLMSKTPTEAEAIIAKLPLKLAAPEAEVGTSKVVASQDPTAGRTARPGDLISVTLTP